MPVLSTNSHKILGVTVLAGLMLAVSGCASSHGGGAVAASTVGEVARVKEGTVVSVLPVQIQAGKGGNLLGTAIGAAIGGIAGSQVGGGREENAVGAIAGATVGGAIGNAVTKGAGTSPGYEYTIRLSTGELISVSQGADIAIGVGAPVLIKYYSDRVRVEPASY